jgi:MoaA/NifB/PqqE/SkfB family radical SAM enzyme
LANLGYIQVVRHCNHHCGFCSNPKAPDVHTLESLKALVDDLVERDYYGVILTGGEPTLHPDLPAVCAYAHQRGLHVRMITNGSRGHDDAFTRELAQAGLQLLHVSIYSTRPQVEQSIRGVAGTLERAYAAMESAAAHGICVNVNCVINRLNADHLDENVRVLLERHPFIRHFVWNNLDPSMGRAEKNREEYTPRLADFELSLGRALRLLEESGRSFRVEKVPLCYMTEFGWASTETRKIVKGEERVVHFLDDKGTVRQTQWDHIYAPDCRVCSLKSICGGLFDRGNGYDPAELHPVFVDRDALVTRIIQDPDDPSRSFETLGEWRQRFDHHSADPS